MRHVDARLDIAFVMPFTPLDLPPLPRADSRHVTPGEPVSAIGHPHGLDYSVTQDDSLELSRVASARHLENAAALRALQELATPR